MRATGSSVAVMGALIVLAGCSSDALTAAPTNPETSITPTTTALTPSTTTTVEPPVTSTTVPRPSPRVLLIGDSTLLAVNRYNAHRALRGFDYEFDAESCRTLGIPSCGERPLPPNAVEAIAAADGSFDYLVVMAGYDEWWTSFPDSFDEVIAAARAKGTRRIIWLTYREGVVYKLLTGELADEAFVKNNQTLRDKLASGAYPDVVLADWNTHTKADNGWVSRDGIHLTREGALGVADYISRWIAHVEARPCPMPAVRGGVVEPTCPNPDTQPPIADVIALYKS